MKVSGALTNPHKLHFRPYTLTVEIETPEDDAAIKELSHHNISVPDVLSESLTADQQEALVDFLANMLKARDSVINEGSATTAARRKQ